MKQVLFVLGILGAGFALMLGLGGFQLTYQTGFSQEEVLKIIFGMTFFGITSIVSFLIAIFITVLSIKEKNI